MPPLVLVPVAESHVRRHIEPPWPEHAEWCDFYRQPEEQRAVSVSLCPRLATLLFDSLERAGLTSAAPGRVPTIADQFMAIRKAAEAVEIDAELPLSRFLCVYPPALPEFMERIGRIPEKVLRHAHRPHGLLLGVATGAARGQIVPALGNPIEVAGAISIFPGGEWARCWPPRARRRARPLYHGVCRRPSVSGRAGAGAARLSAPMCVGDVAAARG